MQKQAWEVSDLDKNSLIDLVYHKNKRIQDLEKLVEDQKRLRIQDSNQVEEKAARIKEWVTNKLKELENQNKQLRDQNKRQKEAVESLTNKLAALSPLSSPRKYRDATLDKVQYIDNFTPKSPIETIDLNKSLKSRRPQLKRTLSKQDANSSSSSSSSSFDTQEQNIKISINTANSVASLPRNVAKSDVSYISIGNDRQAAHQRSESPLYDTVNIELTNNDGAHNPVSGSPKTRMAGSKKITSTQDDRSRRNSTEDVPPPLPLHQSDRWELQLYELAEQAFSSLSQIENESLTKRNELLSRKSSHLDCERTMSDDLMHNIESVVKPKFTTIDGDQVIDEYGPDQEAMITGMNRASIRQSMRRLSNEQSSCSSSTQSDHLNSHSNNSQLQTSRVASSENAKLIVSGLFDSPIKSRTGKDSILRTQSVKRNPAPEKLYDFISSDLVKRGYLIKSGGLRNHSRWIVLKNFHLHSFKREMDELAKSSPNLIFKLEPTFKVISLNPNSDGFPFKISYHDKNLVLIATSLQDREHWLKILNVAINLSDVEPQSLRKQSSIYEGIISVTRSGHSKRCHAVLISHLMFFLKSPIDPTPISYVSVKNSKIREITDVGDYDMDEQDLQRQKNTCCQDCSLAIYPKFSLNVDPIYLSIGNQQDLDEWLYFLSTASGEDQSSGTPYERTLTQMMISNTMSMKGNFNEATNCIWRDHPYMLYSSVAIDQPLTGLPNETLKTEAMELFKSIQLFSQVPLEPSAIDYHVCLLQNCFERIVKYPELRNELYAQLIKQSTFIIHKCCSSKLSSSGSSGCSSINQRFSVNSFSPQPNECHIASDIHSLETLPIDRRARSDVDSTSQFSSRDRTDYSPTQLEEVDPPTQNEIKQILQILAIAVSLNLPRGRMRWWLVDHLKKFANSLSDVGKYALYTLQAIERTSGNGPRDTVPSKTEIMGVLMRNPYDHSEPHSLPINFADGSYLVVGADGSTTVEELFLSMKKSIDIRLSLMSDFYLFADDPCDSEELHILEPQRKIWDVVGWWERGSRQKNFGPHRTSRVIRLVCKKRLLLQTAEGETDQERLLIVHQINRGIVAGKLPISETLIVELGSIMAQLTLGDYDQSDDSRKQDRILERIALSFLPSQCKSSHDLQSSFVAQVVERWKNISVKSGQECIRVYLNCIRRLKLAEH